MIARYFVLPVVMVSAIWCGRAVAQGTFPAPLPGQDGQDAAAPASPVPYGAATGTPNDSVSDGTPQWAFSERCRTEFIPLREEAERRGKLIKAASDRHAPPDEACKLIGSFGQAEIKLIKYVETNAASCGIPTRVTDQLKSRHKGTEVLQSKVCAAALRMQRGEPAGPTGDFGNPGGPS